jgi:hypothetical protein
MSHHNNVTYEVEHFLKSHTFIKSATAAVVAAGLDNYLNDQGRLTNSIVLSRNASFGLLVGGSIIAADYIAPSLTHLVPIPDTALFSGKTLEHRLIEVSLGTATAVGLNRFAFQQSVGSVVSQIGIVVLSDFIGEYVADYAKSKPLSYLT